VRKKKESVGVWDSETDRATTHGSNIRSITSINRQMKSVIWHRARDLGIERTCQLVVVVVIAVDGMIDTIVAFKLRRCVANNVIDAEFVRLFVRMRAAHRIAMNFKRPFSQQRVLLRGRHGGVCARERLQHVRI
jgi:hypothetical protein